MWVGSARIKFQNIWRPLKWSQCWVICIIVHFFTLIFKFPSISFRLLLFSVLFMPSFVSSHLNSATYLTHLRKVCKLDDTAAVWPDPSVDAVDTHVSLHICWELVLWTVPGSDALERLVLPSVFYTLHVETESCLLQGEQMASSNLPVRTVRAGPSGFLFLGEIQVQTWKWCWTEYICWCGML